MADDVTRFLRRDNGSGSGYSFGCGSGSGSGSGDGSGYGSGSGSGSGDGSGYGSGSGSDDGSYDGSGLGADNGSSSGSDDGSGLGSGYGFGFGSGFGSGDSYGYGSGYGSGITDFCSQAVYYVDGVRTLIDHIHGNAAKGCILMGDLTTRPCYIVRGGGMFAHGDTLREAMDALQDKLYETMDVKERIEAFLQVHREDIAYPARDLFAWHNRLTGSCEAGRKAFCADHSINLDEDRYTVAQFIELTRDAYGGKVIRQLEEAIQKRETEGAL